jgi:hypothetical protein
MTAHFISLADDVPHVLAGVIEQSATRTTNVYR